MFLRSPQIGQAIPLYDGRLLIGRRRDCDIVLESTVSSVSRRHAELKVKGAVVEIRDLDSHNGTQVNGKDLQPERWYRLEVGSWFEICNFQFQLVGSNDQSDSDSKIVTSTKDGHESFAISAARMVAPPSTDRIPNVTGQLHGVFEIAKSLRNALELDTILAKTADSLLNIFPGAQQVAIGLVDADKNFQQEQVRLRGQAPPSQIELSRTIVAHVVSSGQAALFEDAARAFTGVDSVLHSHARCVLAAPFVDSEGAIAGLIYVDSIVPCNFTEEDLELLVCVSSMITLAYNFSKLHKAAMHDAAVRRDVESARHVQQTYLPENIPTIDNYKLSTFYRAARHIGGDYYDFIPLSSGKLAIVLGDVAGKGVPAALTMVRLATETRACFETLTSPAEILTRLNRRFGDAYITMIIAILDPVAHQLTIGNAGHECPIVLERGESFFELDESHSGWPLGVSDAEVYREFTIPLASGASLTIFSDGFPDAECTSGERYGKERMGPLLLRCQKSSADIVAQVISQVDQFIGDHPQFDDMCLVHVARL